MSRSYGRTTAARVPAALRARRKFKANALIAETDPSEVTYGQLSDDDRAELAEALADGELAYIVYSCGTPIAWVDTHGEVVLIDDYFSEPTTRHQQLVYAVLREDQPARGT